MASLAVLNNLHTSPTRFPFGVTRGLWNASGSADALPVESTDVFVTTAGVDAMTLATPKGGIYNNTGVPQSIGDPRDDGKVLFIYDTIGHAHTITTSANIINGNKHIATFNGTLGSYIMLEAFNGVWYARETNGVALT